MNCSNCGQPIVLKDGETVTVEETVTHSETSNERAITRRVLCLACAQANQSALLEDEQV